MEVAAHVLKKIVNANNGKKKHGNLPSNKKKKGQQGHKKFR